MPPSDSHKTLSQDVQNLIKEWIKQGAEYEEHWSFVAPKAVNIPDKKNYIDHHITNFHNSKNLKFNKESDKRTLARRLSFDLTGLPLSKEILKKYLNNSSPAAFEKLVDKLLELPAYGEHQARYWLDSVRYADTHGLHADNYREMYLYRDWVIKAYNQNMPFNQFATEQLAGDLLENPSQDQLIASGFNRLHLSNSAGSALKEELFVNNVKDRTDAFGTIFLGMTLGCASCHDHKYDPISQKEYYQLYAFFNSLDGPPDSKGLKNPKPFLALTNPEQQKQLDDRKQKIKTEKDSKQKKQLTQEMNIVYDSVTTTLIMKETKEPRQAYILNRGEYDNPGEKVNRNTPEFLPPMSNHLPINRLGLAIWLTDPKHPIMARVTVNRIWQQFFGIGLVKTSEDFGSQGKWPSQPELLDQLAYEFIQSGWNVKKLIKEIVMSQTYRQSSIASNESYLQDPENAQFIRGPRFRMDVEMLRDQALSFSGLLSTEMFGPSVKPPQPKGLWQSVALKASNTKYYMPDKDDKTYRRSLYTFWKRALPNPTLTTFNAPTREICTPRRERTNTPLQALVLMNEKQFFEAALKLGELTIKNGGNTDTSRLNYLFKKMFMTKATQQEIEILKDCLFEISKSLQYTPKVQLAEKSLDRESAIWGLVANALMGTDKFKTKE